MSAVSESTQTSLDTSTAPSSSRRPGRSSSSARDVNPSSSSSSGTNPGLDLSALVTLCISEHIRHSHVATSPPDSSPLDSPTPVMTTPDVILAKLPVTLPLGDDISTGASSKVASRTVEAYVAVARRERGASAQLLLRTTTSEENRKSSSAYASLPPFAVGGGWSKPSVGGQVTAKYRSQDTTTASILFLLDEDEEGRGREETENDPTSSPSLLLRVSILLGTQGGAIVSTELKFDLRRRRITVERVWRPVPPGGEPVSGIYVHDHAGGRQVWVAARDGSAKRFAETDFFRVGSAEGSKRKHPPPPEPNLRIEIGCPTDTNEQQGGAEDRAANSASGGVTKSNRMMETANEVHVIPLPCRVSAATSLFEPPVGSEGVTSAVSYRGCGLSSFFDRGSDDGPPLPTFTIHVGPVFSSGEEDYDWDDDDVSHITASSGGGRRPSSRSPMASVPYHGSIKDFVEAIFRGLAMGVSEIGGALTLGDIAIGDEDDEEDENDNVNESASAISSIQDTVTASATEIIPSAAPSAPPPPSPWTSSAPILPLQPASNLLDPPRSLLSFIPSPNGTLAAASDTLGRILIIDLDARVVLRIYKGMRGAQCAWSSGEKLVTYHPGKNSVEIWDVRRGRRLGARGVQSDKARLVSYTVPGEDESGGCFLLGMDNENKLAILEPLGAEMLVATASPAPTKLSQNGEITTTAAPRMQRLRQMLDLISTPPLEGENEKATPITPSSILNALEDVLQTASPGEALEAVHAIVTSEIAEMTMNDSSLARQVLDLVRQKMLHSGEESSISPTSVASEALATRIQFYSQVVSAHEVLHKFESSSILTDPISCSSSPHGEISAMGFDETPTPTSATSESSSGENAALEARGWIATWDVCSILGCNDPLSIRPLPTSPLKLSLLVGCCRILQTEAEEGVDRGLLSTHELVIGLNEGSKDWRIVLGHLFLPLCHDIFSFKITRSIFQNLGQGSSTTILQLYTGEWFMTLPISVAEKVSFSNDKTSFRPVLRWLVDLVSSALDSAKEEEAQTVETYLQTLLKFCTKSSDLIRAFLLATLCREAISSASSRHEARTYGKISHDFLVQPWNTLLRRLRFCLLVSLRLGEASLSQPLTVSSVDSGSHSIYSWIGRDELDSIGHTQTDIATLEIQSNTAQTSFHPCSTKGDVRWKVLQKACEEAAAKRKGEGGAFLKKDSDGACVPSPAKYFLSDGDKPGPLIFYLKPHNSSVELAAHRGLILGRMWVEQPDRLDLLENSIAALLYLEHFAEKRLVSSAVSLEIWQACIRPIYRALLFGFEDVHELDESNVAPLLDDFEWFQTFSKLSIDIVQLLVATIDIESRSEGHYDFNAKSSWEYDSNDENEQQPSWPPIGYDPTLCYLENRIRSTPIVPSALRVHQGLVYASRLALDLSSIDQCVPSVDESFDSTSLFVEMTESSTACPQNRIMFIRSILLDKALAVTAPGMSMDKYVSEVISLGRSWDLNDEEIRARFLLALYETNHDAVAEDLMTTAVQNFDSSLFVAGALEIACTRLQLLLNKLRGTKKYGYVLGMLDADTCQWITKKSEEVLERQSNEVFDKNDHVPTTTLSLAATHSLILHIVVLSKNVGGSEKASALNDLSSSLLKTLTNDQITVASLATNTSDANVSIGSMSNLKH